jgi:hypothetical protein
MITQVQTIVLANATQVVTGSSIDLINRGAATGSFTGNAANCVPVDLPVSASYTFEYNKTGYSGILVDATGTEIHIVRKF